MALSVAENQPKPFRERATLMSAAALAMLQRDLQVTRRQFLWNDLLFSLTFISSDGLRTVQTGLLNFTGEYGQIQGGPTCAAICLAVFPTLILYLLLNQQVIKGLTAGSLKG